MSINTLKLLFAQETHIEQSWSCQTHYGESDLEERNEL